MKLLIYDTFTEENGTEWSYVELPNNEFGWAMNRYLDIKLGVSLSELPMKTERFILTN